jgi:hypothetical protein
MSTISIQPVLPHKYIHIDAARTIHRHSFAQRFSQILSEMRLLQYNNDGEFSLTQFLDNIPRYAILSHTWGPEEVTFKDMADGNGTSKAGFDKIRFSGEQARRDHLQYFWVDTCCIDKSNAIELQEAINSMFRWYQNAVKCYVYLSDVSTKKRKASDSFTECTWEPAFRSSKWFTRGWTLQELLAPGPGSVEFFSQERDRLGGAAKARKFSSAWSINTAGSLKIN